MSTNEAAERLRGMIDSWTAPATTRALQANVDEALAAERRATVERIRARCDAANLDPRHGVYDILDEEAAR